MTFIWPPLLVALALVPVGVLAARTIEARRRRDVAALTGPRPAAPIVRTGRRIRDRLPGALLVAGFVVLAIALARPQATVALPRIEGTVMLTFDVSGSMAATDVAPSRMEVAKAVGRSIVEGQPPGVVIGVVAFSDGGLAVLQPTADRSEVLAAIERLAPTRGTSLGQGVLTALTAIERSAADTPPEYYSNRSPAPTASPVAVPPGSRASTAIVVLSDGENTVRPNPLEAAAAAADAGIRVVALGVGTGEGVTLEVEGFRVHTRLDEPLLQTMADMTAGSYHRADDPEAVAAVFDDLARDVVIRSEEIEVTALFAAAAGLLFMLSGAASLARSGRLP